MTANLIDYLIVSQLSIDYHYTVDHHPHDRYYYIVKITDHCL